MVDDGDAQKAPTEMRPAPRDGRCWGLAVLPLLFDVVRTGTLVSPYVYPEKGMNIEEELSIPYCTDTMISVRRRMTSSQASAHTDNICTGV